MKVAVGTDEAGQVGQASTPAAAAATASASSIAKVSVVVAAATFVYGAFASLAFTAVNLG